MNVSCQNNFKDNGFYSDDIESHEDPDCKQKIEDIKCLLTDSSGSLTVFRNPYILNCGHIEDADTLTKTNLCWSQKCPQCKEPITSAIYVPRLRDVCDALQSTEDLSEIVKERPEVQQKILRIYPQENLTSGRKTSNPQSLVCLTAFLALAAFSLGAFFSSSRVKEGVFIPEKQDNLLKLNISNSNQFLRRESEVNNSKKWLVWSAKKISKEEQFRLDQEEIAVAERRVKSAWLQNSNSFLKLVKRGVGLKQAIQACGMWLDQGQSTDEDLKNVFLEIFKQGEGYSEALDIATRNLAVDWHGHRRFGLWLFELLFMFGRDHLDVADFVIREIEDLKKPIPNDVFYLLQDHLKGKEVNLLLITTAVRWMKSDNWRVQKQALDVALSVLKTDPSQEALEAVKAMLEEEKDHPLLRKVVLDLRGEMENLLKFPNS